MFLEHHSTCLILHHIRMSQACELDRHLQHFLLHCPMHECLSDVCSEALAEEVKHPALSQMTMCVVGNSTLSSTQYMRTAQDEVRV